MTDSDLNGMGVNSNAPPNPWIVIEEIETIKIANKKRQEADRERNRLADVIANKVMHENPPNSYIRDRGTEQYRTKMFNPTKAMPKKIDEIKLGKAGVFSEFPECSWF